MSNNNQDQNFTESSSSVQTHLGILQSTIQRMASNSNSSKNWCITTVSGVLVIVAGKDEPNFALISLIPTILFLALDAYYLALEKAFRESYNNFIKKLHEGQLQPQDFYSVFPTGKMPKHRLEALKSFSIWGFYLPLILLILLARSFVFS